MVYTIYTDGSCLRNPNGPGGWAVVIVEENGYEYYFADGDPSTTNNRMELTAVIEAVSLLKQGQECLIYSDSQLTINCATGKWKRKANLDLWAEYEKFSKNKKIKFEWVKANNGNHYNEIVDKLAFNEAKKV
jgi:ribonuclease HI